MASSYSGLLVSRIRQYFHSGAPALYRLAWVGLALLVVCMLAGAVLNLLGKYATDREITRRLERQVQQQQAANDRDAARKRYLSSPEGRVNIAIERGWVKPGDRSVTFPPQGPAPASLPSNTPAEDTTVGGLVLAALALFLVAFLTGIGLLIYRWRAMRQPRPAGTLTPRSELRRRPAPQKF